jgi:hypothetical protein
MGVLTSVKSASSLAGMKGVAEGFSLEDILEGVEISKQITWKQKYSACSANKFSKK